MTLTQSNLTQIIEFIAARASRNAARAARRDTENRGYIATFGQLGQKAMGIRSPTSITADHRARVASQLKGMGCSVRINTATDRAGRTAFASFTVTATGIAT